MANSSGSVATMSSLTYGRDSSGRKKLLADYQSDITKAIKVLEDESATVIATVRKNWAGVDADKFIKVFSTDVTNLKTVFKAYSSFIEEQITADAKQFSKDQQKIANKIS